MKKSIIVKLSVLIITTVMFFSFEGCNCDEHLVGNPPLIDTTGVFTNYLYRNDSLVVRAILDSNGFYDTSVDQITASSYNSYNLSGERRIRHLCLHGIKILPEVIGTLRGLYCLEISSDSLHSIPYGIYGLWYLEKLSITNCPMLDSLPDVFGILRNIDTLLLYNNNLQKLPETIGKLQKLSILVGNKNKINHLPSSFINLKRLEKLDLRENLLVSSMALIKNGPFLLR